MAVNRNISKPKLKKEGSTTSAQRLPHGDHPMPVSMTEVASSSWLNSHPDFKDANATPALSPIQIFLFWEDPAALSKAIWSIRNVAEKSGCRVLLEGESDNKKIGYNITSRHL